jgi:hypothetical protein
VGGGTVKRKIFLRIAKQFVAVSLFVVRRSGSVSRSCMTFFSSSVFMPTMSEGLEAG